MPKSEKFQQLPAPWDRIFSLTTRIFVWGLLAGIVYLLRPFFLLIFLTFVFTYIQSHAVDGLAHRIKNRVARVILVLLIFLGLITGTLYFLAPQIRQQTGDFFNNSGKYMAQADEAIYKFVDNNPSLKSFLEPADEEGAGENPESKDGDAAKTPDKPAGQGAGQKPVPGTDTQARPPLVQPMVQAIILAGDDGKSANLESRLSGLVAAGAGILGATSSFLLSILFSFLIVLDFPKLSRMVAGMSNTRLDFIYEEVADNIHAFAKRLGRALEAQVLIALVNTILTSIGVWILGIPNVTFLGAIVFFCSFIPVAGVFISSAPICLLALQTGGDGGIKLMLLAIAMVLLVHTIEAYILNPKIYGHHLRMNAVLVLIVLTICGKLFGVWGLVLGLPVVNYVFSVAIQWNDDDEEAESGGAAPA
ncbi:MAG: AI-2E family transporter [Planctomycetota bacterium]|nr:AI-2E family transporter [Planctomycetota bacterium]